ncbi:hypothetical protein GCM10023188_45880 [Pontibacter saemangeumensis]|uniref:Uncharacterized protein n=1 Tax=Pontibacter saemangeumensis TaxID=1084525 RepID=A0ABP8M474_9BACT
MHSQRAKETRHGDPAGGAMATFLPHLLVQLIALFTASGGLILLAFSEWSGAIFALLFLLFQVCLHFFIRSTNSYVQAISDRALHVVMQVVQSAFVVMGVAALGLLFYWLFQWCFYYWNNESASGDFYFDWHGAVLSQVPPLVWVGAIGEVIRQGYPLLQRGAAQLQKYFTTWG